MDLWRKADERLPDFSFDPKWAVVRQDVVFAIAADYATALTLMTALQKRGEAGIEIVAIETEVE